MRPVRKSADDRDAERTAEFRTGRIAQNQRQGAKNGRHGRHQNRTEPQEAGFINRIARIFSLLAFRRDREVHHQDRIFFTRPMSSKTPMMAMKFMFSSSE